MSGHNWYKYSKRQDSTIITKTRITRTDERLLKIEPKQKTTTSRDAKKRTSCDSRDSSWSLWKTRSIWEGCSVQTRRCLSVRTCINTISDQYWRWPFAREQNEIKWESIRDWQKQLGCRSIWRKEWDQLSCRDIIFRERDRRRSKAGWINQSEHFQAGLSWPSKCSALTDGTQNGRSKPHH